ncbi:hypothetical protein RE428_13950 [Marinobacter nanhaiticus D15-8W]|uniref:ATP-binding protein n=1 Tax=Marinobacter nanhaiticus D15-8W TaxID=626887 RepID=N6WW01_9GAMM|nr:ATP-binding protein [Marinobacter nanhaiticus]ENO13023.1 ATP-binding protein [Marinobacter nanhaiticus D15-8W]BES70377.1 hypothetical protein RE428_13950 [Marinobacter nanhaiticus D15-8W]
MTTTNLSFQLSDANELPTALNWLTGHFSEAGADASVNAELKRLLDIEVNHLFHHHADEPRRVEMHVELELDRGQVCVRLIDNGQPYNPLQNGSGGSALTGNASSQSLVEALSDEQVYYRRHEQNILVLTRHFPAV